MQDIINKGVKVERLGVYRKMDRKLSVLLIKLDHMGDLILAIPAIMKLKEKLKYADIDIIVGEWNVDLAKKLGLFKNIFVYNFFKKKSSTEPGRSAEEEAQIIKKLGWYDIAIDLRRPPDTRFLITKVDSKLKVAFTSFSEYDRLLDICLETDDVFYEFGVAKNHNKQSISSQMIKLIDSIPLETLALLNWTTLPIFEKNIAIFPGAGQELKQWPIQYFVQLVKNIIESKIADKVNVYFSSTEGTLIEYFRHIPAISIFVGLKFDELIQSLLSNAVTVANNSFGSHLSSFLGLPLVAIYGGHETRWEWQPPFGSNTIIFSDISCSPCHIGDIQHCPYDLICLKQIMPQIVMKIIREHLSGNLTSDTERYFYYINRDL